MGISSAGKEAEQREVPLAAGGKAKWYDHFGKDSHVDGFGRPSSAYQWELLILSVM